MLRELIYYSITSGELLNKFEEGYNTVSYLTYLLL